MQMYERIHNFDSLYNAHLKARRGNSEKAATIKFEINLMEAILLLKQQLIDKTYSLQSTRFLRFMSRKSVS